MDEARPDPFDAVEQRSEDLRKHRERAVWYGVVGIGLLFGASFHSGFLIGGVLMALYGVGSYVWYTVRMTRLYDPWKDQDLDEWEEEHLERR